MFIGLREQLVKNIRHGGVKNRGMLKLGAGTFSTPLPLPSYLHLAIPSFHCKESTPRAKFS